MHLAEANEEVEENGGDPQHEDGQGKLRVAVAVAGEVCSVAKREVDPNMDRSHHQQVQVPQRRREVPEDPEGTDGFSCLLSWGGKWIWGEKEKQVDSCNEEEDSAQRKEGGVYLRQREIITNNQHQHKQ